MHCLDALRFVLADEPRSISVLATQDTASGEVEASATMQLAMRSGALANVTCTARAPYRTLLEVTGSEGVLLAENGLSVDRPVDVVLRKGGELVETTTLSNADGYTQMLNAFAAACRVPAGNAQAQASLFSPNGADGVLNQRLLDAAYRSWHSGQREIF